MFGHVMPNLNKLSDEERQRYNQVYCGLCHTLGDVHGVMARFALTYDMTFLVLMLSSLYEPKEESFNHKCFIHPKKSKTFSRNIYSEYAADMSVFLVYYKCIDDWKDDKNFLKYSYASMIKKKYNGARNRYPKQADAIKNYIDELSKLENSDALADEMGLCFGKIVGTIFKYQDDLWGNRLFEFGTKLGKFIYFLDASIDIEKDSKNGAFNPFTAQTINREDIEKILLILVGEATEVFETLPLIQDENILRNILYMGIWTKYNSQKMKIERKTKNGH